MKDALLTVTVDGSVVTARGEIDLTTADSFRYGIECAIHESAGEVVADLRAVDFIDSAATWFWWSATTRSRPQGGASAR